MDSFNRLFELFRKNRWTRQTRRSQQHQKPLTEAEAVEARMLLTSPEEALFNGVVIDEIAPSAQVSEWFVHFDSAKDVNQLMADTGARAATPSEFVNNGYMLEFQQGMTLQQATDLFSSVADFDYMYPEVERTFDTRAIPNDPLFSDQWHLQNTGQGNGAIGADANITSVWDNYTGAGVTIAIVDDGLEVDHPDLAANVNTTIDFDFNDNDDDPSPGAGDNHGTAVGGVSSAVGNNGLGVSGASWNAELVGLRLIAGGFGDQTSANALTHEFNTVDIYNNSWGPADNGRISSIGPQTLAALERSATAGRNGLGNIHVWAGGNGGDNTNDNVNYDPYANSRHTLAVGALTNSGRRSSYSDVGAPLIVTAYSNGGSLGITTTDNTGAAGYDGSDYTSTFGGTSSAAPLVAGVIGLILEANPNLTYRDVTDILVRNSERVDPGNSDWVQNGAGLWVNHEYGFGGIDAQAAVSAALVHKNLDPEKSFSTGLQSVNQAIPDGGTVSHTVSVPPAGNISLEYVEIEFSATHGFIGDLEIVLTSPEGTRSVLAATRGQDGNTSYRGFVFSSARHWGESSGGDWTIDVSDNGNNGTGSFDSYELRFYGTDPLGLVVTESAGSTVVSDFQITDTVDVQLSVAPVEDVVIDISNGDPTEVVFSPTSLTFTAANWNVAQTVSFQGVLDLTQDGPQTTPVTFAVNAALSDDVFDNIGAVTINVTSQDDDGTIPTKPTLFSPDQFPDSSQPIFAWTPGLRSDNFSIMVTNVITGVVISQQSGIRASQFQFGLPFDDGLYEAIVTPFNSVGQAGVPSDPLIFNIGEPVVPTAPTIVNPVNGSTETTGTPIIAWDPVPGATDYELYIQTQRGVVRLNTPGTLAGGLLTYTPSQRLAEGTTTVWIRGINFFGTAGDWSTPTRFTINSVDLPETPRLTAPLLSTTANAFPTFEWTSTLNASRYELWVSELRPGTGTAQIQAVYDRVIHVTNTNETSYTHFRPLNEVSHRAWVRAFNSAGEASPWSAAIGFAIDVPDPETPGLVDIPQTQDLTPTFSWSDAGSGAGTTYRLWVNNLSTGENRVIDVDGISGTSYTPSTNLKQGRHRAWVQATTAAGAQSPWSAPIIVNIDIPAPERPVVNGPSPSVGETVVQSEFPTWTWTAVPNAARYELWVNHIESRTTKVIHETHIEGTSFTSTDPAPEGSFRAWVRGINEADEVGRWSQVHLTTIDVPLPDIPTITGPTPNPVGAVTDSTPTISWATLNPGQSYDLQLRQTSTGDIVHSATGIEGLTYTIPNALAEVRFEVRVQAYNSVGEASGWSDWYGFRIDEPNATTPTAISPTGTVTEGNITFTWSHAADSVRYQLLVLDLNDQENTVVDVTTFELDASGLTASYTLPMQDGTYRYWVRAFNSQNTASGWSNSLSFIVEDRLTSLEDLDGDVMLVSFESQTEAKQQVEELPADYGDVAATPQTREGEKARRNAEGTPATELPADQGMINEEQLQELMVRLADPQSGMMLEDS